MMFCSFQKQTLPAMEKSYHNTLQKAIFFYKNYCIILSFQGTLSFLLPFLKHIAELIIYDRRKTNSVIDKK